MQAVRIRIRVSVIVGLIAILRLLRRLYGAFLSDPALVLTALEELPKVLTAHAMLSWGGNSNVQVMIELHRCECYKLDATVWAHLPTTVTNLNNKKMFKRHLDKLLPLLILVRLHPSAIFSKSLAWDWHSLSLVFVSFTGYGLVPGVLGGLCLLC